MRHSAQILAVLSCGAFLLGAPPTYGDSAKEGLRAARRNILEGVRDEIQRRLRHRSSELKLGRIETDPRPARHGSRSKKP